MQKLSAQCTTSWVLNYVRVIIRASKEDFSVGRRWCQSRFRGSKCPPKKSADKTTELERVFWRWIYVQLRSKIFSGPLTGSGKIAPPPVDRPLDNQLNACLIHYRPTLTWSRLPRNSAVNPVADASIHEARQLATIAQGPDLQNILRQSYDYLTIMPKLRSTYDRFTQNILQWMESFSWVRFTCKIVISSEIAFVN